MLYRGHTRAPPLVQDAVGGAGGAVAGRPGRPHGRQMEVSSSALPCHLSATARPCQGINKKSAAVALKTIW